MTNLLILFPSNPPKVFSFDELAQLLKDIFYEPSSSLNFCCNCLNPVRSGIDDYLTYASVLNRQCERFKLRKRTEDQFKCLSFICGLQSPRDVDIRARLLSKFEQNPSVNHDTAIIDRTNLSQFDHVHAVSKIIQRPGAKKQSVAFSKPPTSYWKCNKWHFARFCPFKKHQCQKCHKKGYKEECCRTTFSQQGNWKCNGTSPVSAPSRSTSVRSATKKDTKKSACCTTFSQQGNKPFKQTMRPSKPHTKPVLVSFNPDWKRQRKFVRLQLDTASDITVIPKDIWKIMGRPLFNFTTRVALNASGGKLQLTGELPCSVLCNNIRFTGMLLALGYQAALWTRVHGIKKALRKLWSTTENNLTFVLAEKRKLVGPHRKADEYRALNKDSTIAGRELDTGQIADLGKFRYLVAGLRFIPKGLMIKVKEMDKQSTIFFYEPSSSLNFCCNCLNPVRSGIDDYLTYASVLNRQCERFKLRKRTEDQFKCLSFICGLQSPRDVDIRARLLSKFEQNPSVNHDTAIIDRTNLSQFDHVHAVSKIIQRPGAKKQSVAFSKPPTSYWKCNKWHFARFCPFKKHQCQKCHKKGYKEECCRTTFSQQGNKPFKQTMRPSKPHTKPVLVSFNPDWKRQRKFVRLQLDTASDITVIPKDIWKIMGRPLFNFTTRVALNASGGKVVLTHSVVEFHYDTESDSTFESWLR
ncbi:hypothetical protein T265_05588 [Opisthorchis viverrini]|uniref:Peptidase A2 domain-containing protein n=1 Tax=Opisthorchis viverrini TaxID=6198 RepID=A0A074ZJX7_OPIVI|nr:hypothetical protein T265_05588 [Opisthorchis viverrini]KER27341.1 hypothetical protein T265_05588 [Opisthorchis viverrini]